MTNFRPFPISRLVFRRRCGGVARIGFLGFLGCLALLFCLTPATIVGQETGDLPEAHTASGVSVRPIVTFEHSGYFRFRADLFGNAFLSDQAGGASGAISGFSTPISLNEANAKEDAELDPADAVGLAAGANMRLRWEPTITIGQLFRIHGQLDVFDNLVLGSTPAYGPGDPLHPIVFFAESQAPPSAGVNSLRDGIRLKQLWADFSLLNLVRFQLGRIPNHWGLGMLYNDGSCPDCDYGDSVDGAFLSFPIMSDMWVRGGWFFPGEGALLGESDTFFGQPYDGTALDDVHAVVLDIYSEPQTSEAIAEREQVLQATRLPAWDWGVRNVVRFQDYASDLQSNVPIPGCPTPSTRQTDPTLNQPFDCTFLLSREALFWTSDAWLRMDWRPSASERVLFELEVAGVFLSEVDQLQGPDAGADSGKEFWAGAGIARGTYQRGDIRVGLEVGAASGDDVQTAGIWDRSVFVVPVDAAYNQPENADIRNNAIVSNFVFNRAYHTDLLLFREVMGAVTNTVYTHPWIAWDFIKKGDWVLGARGDLLYAASMNPEGTPGRDRHLGLEADAQFFLHVGDQLHAVLEGGYLYPLQGLDSIDLGLEASPAWTVQARLHVFF